jgi:hypothetical protein
MNALKQLFDEGLQRIDHQQENNHKKKRYLRNGGRRRNNNRNNSSNNNDKVFVPKDANGGIEEPSTYIEAFFQSWSNIKAKSNNEKLKLMLDKVLGTEEKRGNKLRMYTFFYLFLLCLQENKLDFAEEVLNCSEKFADDIANRKAESDTLDIHAYRLWRVRHERTNETALHYSCYYGYPKITEILIKKGCETEAFDHRRLSPWGVANKSFTKVLLPPRKNKKNYKNNKAKTSDDQTDDNLSRDNIMVVENKNNSKSNNAFTTKPRAIENIVTGIVESASMLISFKNDYKLLTTVYFEGSKRRNKDRKRITLANAVVRYFGMNNLILQMKRWPLNTGSKSKERMLQLILRAEADKNLDLKMLKQQKKNVYLQLPKNSSLKKHDNDMLTQETFDFLNNLLIQKNANPRLVSGYTDLISIRGSKLLDEQNCHFFKRITGVIKCLCEMLLLNMTHSIESDSEMDSDDEVDLPDNKEEILLYNFFRMFVMFFLPRFEKNVLKKNEELKQLQSFLHSELEETFDFTFSILKLIFEEVASLRRLAVILKLYAAWSLIKNDLISMIVSSDTNEQITANEKCSSHTKLPTGTSDKGKSTNNIKTTKRLAIDNDHSANRNKSGKKLPRKSQGNVYFRLVQTALNKNDALHKYACNAIHRHGMYTSHRLYGENTKHAIGTKFMNDILRLHIEKKKKIPESVCKRFVNHRDAIMVMLRSEPLLLRSVLTFLAHIPNALALGAKAETVILAARRRVHIYEEDEHQWTLRFNRLADNENDAKFAMESIANQIVSLDKESILGHMNVEFIGEQGIGDGLTREFIDLISTDLFLKPVGTSNIPLFEKVENNNIFVKRSQYFEDFAAPTCGHFITKKAKRLKKRVETWLSSDPINVLCPCHPIPYSLSLQYMYQKVGKYVDGEKMDEAYLAEHYSSDYVVLGKAKRVIATETEKMLVDLQERRIFYRCIGRFIGLSIINRQPLSISLPLLFFKQLLELPFVFDDLKEIDMQVYKSLNMLDQNKKELASNLKDTNVLPFAPIPFTELETMKGATTVYKELVDNKRFKPEIDDNYNSLEPDYTSLKSHSNNSKGTKVQANQKKNIVTHKNVKRYVKSAALEFALGHRSDAITTIRSGLLDIIPKKNLNVFTAEELKLLVCNTARKINLNELKDHVQYRGGLDESHVIVRWFWKWALQLEGEMKGALLLFWSGSSTPPLHGFLPISDNGFDLHDEDMTWSIRANWEIPNAKQKGKFETKNDRINSMLPNASTCSREMAIPARFTSYEYLAKSMNIALNFGSNGYEFQ